MSLDFALAVVIKVPPEAVVPIIVAGLSLGLLAFGGKALQA